MATIPNTRGNPQASDVAVQTALPMVGSASREDLQATLGLVDAELAKLFEDRNFLLADGGTLAWSTGTGNLTLTASLKLHVNSLVAGGSPSVIDLAATTRAFSADGRMLYAVINRTAATATVTADATTLPTVTSTNQEVVLIAKRIGSDLYFRNGMRLENNRSTKLGGSDLYGSLGATSDVLLKTSGTDGKTVQGSGVTLDSSNNVGNFGTGAFGVASPDASAQLQADSTAKGFLPPRMDTTQRNAIASPAVGLQIYNTTTLANESWNGTSWVPAGASASLAYTYVTFTANGIYDIDTFIDGQRPIGEALKVYNVFVTNGLTGSSGTVQVDIKYAASQTSPSWATIFSTLPAFTSSAVSGTWCGVGDTVTGFTAPVLSPSPFVMSNKGALRMDIIANGVGFADLTVTVVLGL